MEKENEVEQVIEVPTLETEVVMETISNTAENVKITVDMDFDRSNTNRKHHPMIASAKRVFKEYKKWNITFEQFLEFSQKPCYNCGKCNTNKYNYFIKDKKNASQYSKDNGTLRYNGLYRIDLTLPFNIENMIVSCRECNKSQNKKSIKLQESIEKNRKYHPSMASARIIHKTYQNGNINFEQFIELTQQPCHFCGIIKSNKINKFIKRDRASEYAKQNGWWSYNGLHKINHQLPYNIDNVFVSCKKCSLSKHRIRISKSQEFLEKDKKHYPTPNISSAYNIYNMRYDDGDITFEQFLNISQQPCNFCGKSNTHKHNRFINVKRASDYAKNNGWWTYNSLIKIDNSLPFNFSNIIVACKECKKIQKIEKSRKHHPMIASANGVYRKTYDDGDITFERFLQLSQLPCHYCGDVKFNTANHFSEIRGSAKSSIEKGLFRYNGLDRINSALPHNLDNVVPACFVCNSAKNKISYTDFLNKIIKIFKNLNLTVDGYGGQ